MEFKTYNYKKAMIDDVRSLINVDFSDPFQYDNKDDYRWAIYEYCWEADSITGNGNEGKYDTDFKTSFYLAGNWELLRTAYSEFSYSEVESIVDPIMKGPAWCDSLIRCYLLGEVVDYCISHIDEDDPRFADNKEEEND